MMWAIGDLIVAIVCGYFAFIQPELNELAVAYAIAAVGWLCCALHAASDVLRERQT